MKMNSEKSLFPAKTTFENFETPRRPSLTPCNSQTSQSSCGEPTILIDDTSAIEEEDEGSERSSCRGEGPNREQSLDIESPSACNPYLLSPWRDPRETRKHSLPTPQCSGITASQVRRLSDRGGGPSPREAAFLATLSSAPAPSPGGRRHSVVTISKVPQSLFGRNRRESIAAYPTAAPPRLLTNRRESFAGAVGPPSTGEHRGSIHNLQLDIMDDIVTARKVRLKCFNTSTEKVCEVQPLDEAGSSSQRYTQPSSPYRRFSEFVGAPLPTIPSEKRRASAQPGIVCTNTDLISILSNLTSSANEINEPKQQKTSPTKILDQKRNRLRKNRSNSFDVSILIDQENTKDTLVNNPRQWFVKRHQPMAKKTKDDNRSRVLWDGRSGSVIDAEQIGSAIEMFLRKSESNLAENVGAIPKTKSGKNSGWYSTKDGEEEPLDSCDTSLCTTLKDLFIK